MNDFSNIVPVTIDDGSGQVKMSYINDKGQLISRVFRSLVESTADCHNVDGESDSNIWVTEFGSSKQFYRVYDKPSNGKRIPTTTSAYQYSDASAVLINHALASDEYLRNKSIYLGVTLPIELFYTGNSEKPFNIDNIKKKRDNILNSKFKSTTGLPTPKIIDVSVFGEGVPAYFYAIQNVPDLNDDDLAGGLLFVDIGMFTCDIAHIKESRSLGAKASKENLGMASIYTELGYIIERMANIEGSGIPSFIRASNVREGLFEESFKKRTFQLNKSAPPVDISKVCDSLTNDMAEKIIQFIESVMSVTRESFPLKYAGVVVVGGGAYALTDAIRSLLPNVFVCQPPEPEKAVCLGSHSMLLGKFEQYKTKQMAVTAVTAEA